MDEDIRLLGEFLNADEELRKSMTGNFYNAGSMVFEESAKDVIRYLSKRLNLSEQQIEQLRDDRKNITNNMIANYLKGAIQYAEGLGRIQCSAEELTNGTLSIDENTYGNAEMHCRRLRGKLSELDDPASSKRISNGPFSRVASSDVDFLRDYVGNNFGKEAVRRYEYYCESEVYEYLSQSVSQANHKVCQIAMYGVDNMQACARRMNKNPETKGSGLAASLL